MLKIFLILFTHLLPASEVSLQNKPFHVTLDAGHGGYDKGAIVENIYESDLALKITQDVAKEIYLLDKDIQVDMVRSQNIFIPLSDRTRKAAEQSTDLFVSIHLNSSKIKSIRGMEVYFSDYQQPDSSLSIADAITRDLEENGRILKSLYFSQTLQTQWSNLKSSIKRASFFVIEKNKAPSVLIELGYLTHQDEKKWLLEEPNQLKMAREIARTIIKYKENSDKMIK